MLNDMYQLTMAYAYWKAGRHEDHAVFELFFRKCPFHGEFTIFAGLDEVLKYLHDFKFTPSDIAYLKTIMPGCDANFFTYLSTLTCSGMTICALEEGTLCFPRIPLLRLSGPLVVGQLLETTLLTLVNYPSLVATNAARYRLAAGPDKTLLEFGLRRAQGPDGGFSASKYCFYGGFDGTSNVIAGKLLGIPVKGTHAHAFVMAFSSLDDVGGAPKSEPAASPSSAPVRLSPSSDPLPMDDVEAFKALVLYRRSTLPPAHRATNSGELAAFIAYAYAFPKGFLALVDTYDTLGSGVLNFLCVAVALFDMGYEAVGVRLDSGDLSYLSVSSRRSIDNVADYMQGEYGSDFRGLAFKKCMSSLQIVASNDINEEVLHALNKQPHSITTFGIGTNLVTCQSQPALGCVYKLVEILGKPRIKLSQDIAKVLIPGRKEAFRLYGAGGHALLDVLCTSDEVGPKAGERFLCRHPFEEQKRVFVTPAKVERLNVCCWDGARGGIVKDVGGIKDIKEKVKGQMKDMRPDHLRAINPTPFKVSVSENLFNFMHQLWATEAPIVELL